MTQQNYDENSITVLEGLEGVRARPTMYIGSLVNGQFQITKELLDNCVDEIQAGGNTFVGCKVENDTITVWDKGRGIPVGPHPSNPNKSTLEIIMTHLHAGGKIKQGAYSAAVGTNGVGASCCNALSTYFQVWTYRDKQWWTQTYKEGKPTTKVIKGKPEGQFKKGTVIKFIPDTTILPTPLNIKDLFNWFRNSAFLNPNIKFYLNYNGKEKILISKGLEDYIKWRTKDLTCEPLYKPFIIKTDNVDLALQWFESDENDLVSWCNTSPTLEGGTHLSGLIKVINKAFDSFAKKKNYKPEDLRTGLYGAINYRTSGPQFDSQTKEKLINADAEKIIMDQVYDAFLKYLNSNKSFVKKVLDRANEIRSIYNKFTQEKKALSKLKSRGKVNLPPANKFIGSNCKEANRRELFICLQGDTEIIDVNSKTYKIKDLVGKDPIIGFGIDMQTKEIRPTLLKDFRLTRKNTDLVRIWLDNGSYIDCTPDHRFVYEANNTYQYIEAKDLTHNVKLITLNQDLKVTKVEPLANKEDVYCLTSDTGNFFLANGVCAKNCEGQSASGTARQARDPHYQEILKLRGKILNVAKSGLIKAYENEDVLNILKAIGFDPTSKERELRVGKIIILTDADVDGCLAGNTRILTLDGRNPTIKELVEEWNKNKKEIEVYSVDKNGNLVVGKAIAPRITRTVQEMCKLTLSNNKEIHCTLDHKWLINNPKKNDKDIIWYEGLPYKLAKDLTEEDRLIGKTNQILKKEFYQQETDVYCMTVHKYHNFMVDDGNGNGICSANSHISTLLLTLFQKLYPEVIEKGMVYTVENPLFIGRTKTKEYYGESLQDLKKQYSGKFESITRAKGLGEIDAPLLKRVAFDPDTRNLQRITQVTDKDLKKFFKIVGDDPELRKIFLKEI